MLLSSGLGQLGEVSVTHTVSYVTVLGGAQLALCFAVYVVVVVGMCRTKPSSGRVEKMNYEAVQVQNEQGQVLVDGLKPKHEDEAEAQHDGDSPFPLSGHNRLNATLIVALPPSAFRTNSWSRRLLVWLPFAATFFLAGCITVCTAYYERLRADAVSKA